MDKVSELTGRSYKPFDYVGAPDAENVIVAMGSVCETIEETMNKLIAEGHRVGLIKVRLYRPFVKEVFPGCTAENGRTNCRFRQNQGAWCTGRAALSGCKSTLLYGERNAPEVYGGRYGLGSKDTTPGMMHVDL